MTVIQTLFMTEPGDTAAISITDVNQGWLGDCFVCSAVASLALQRPDYIRDMVHDNGDGTQSVRLYLTPLATYAFEASKFKLAADSSTWVTVRNSDLGLGMNTNNGGQLIVNGIQEIWPQVIENAIAQVAGGYNVLNYGGNPTGIMSEITGAPVLKTFLSPGLNSTVSASQLKTDLAARNMIAFDTNAQNKYNLISNHSYTLTSIVSENGIDFAKFRNPWGYNDPDLIPISELNNVFTCMEVGSVPSLGKTVDLFKLNPIIKTIIGNRDGGITLTGTSAANSVVTLYDTIAGITTYIGTTSATNSSTWSITSHIGIKTAAINSYTISAQDSAGHVDSMGGQFLLASTGTETLTGIAGQADVFAVMSFKGSDFIQGFETSKAVGSAHDVINLSGRGVASFNQLQPMISGTESAVILLGGSRSITLNNVSASTLTAADFRFS